MKSLLPALIILFALATLGVLLTGVFGMLRGGEFNKRYGNKLMQARVILQGVTIALLVLLMLVYAGK